MKGCWNLSFFLSFTLLIASCVEPYFPEVLSAENNFLVVEGTLNTGGDSTVIYLSRTARLVDSALIKKEAFATVSIESESGNTYLLENKGEGEYAAQLPDLNKKDQYRLRIVSEDKEYLSEFVLVKEAPPIDSVSWVYQDGEVKLFVNTHDPEDNTWFYRWEFEEDWEYRVPFKTYLAYVDRQVVDIVEPPPTQCWQTNRSTNVILGSSTQLQRDIISLKLLTVIQKGSRKIGRRYSILVKQYALSQEAYNYYQQIKKNSEQMGSLFDPQPTEIRGNIHCVGSPKEPVIGFFQAGSTQEKRIFIDNLEVEPWGYRLKCEMKLVENRLFHVYFKFRRFAPVVKLEDGYYWAPAECTDCSLVASPHKPDFWE